ncbi:hypothetical protein BOX15_Mlig028810g1 [Macrostomum lignano]|uniref:Uncharacterized protein n=1 Tax=Macrostomum lignano TaxID=282301 RepID=A0A267EVY9_9PLAT|nr:hypothetical protein BOX15_Mlig028810g1 [Macrostomum lignano]
MPRSSLFKVSDCLPVDEASKTRALSTLRAVTGAGDPKMSVVSRRFCDSAWPRTPADFARPRSVAYGQNLRVHPDLAGAIRTSILEARPAFECVSAAGLAELDRRLPSLAKTRHDEWWTGWKKPAEGAAARSDFLNRTRSHWKLVRQGAGSNPTARRQFAWGAE